jgi:predicted permease
MSLASIASPIVLAVLKVAVVALVGFVLARRHLLHQAALADISALVIGVTVPCLNFVNAANIQGTSARSALLCILGAPFVLALGFAGGNGLGKLLRVQKSHWRPVICAATFQNLTYLPVAVATAVLPPLAALFPGGAATTHDAIAGSGVVAISIFGILYSPLFWGLGLWWLSDAPTTERVSRADLARRLLPAPVVGLLLGDLFGLTPLHFALTPPRAPLHFAFTAVQDIGSLTIPLANLVLGGMLASVGSGRLFSWRDAVTVIGSKLIWIPSVTLTLLWLIRPWWRDDAALSVAAFVVFLEAVSPPPTNLAVMTKGKDLGAANLAGAVVPGLLLVAYSLSLLTMPLWLTLFFHMMQSK